MWLVALAGVLLGGAVVGGFGPGVRLVANAAAARRGALIEVERVVPCWGGVRLKGIRVGLAGVPSVRIGVGEIEVRWGLRGRRIRLHDGTVTALGSRAVVLAEFQAWRGRWRSGSRGTAGGADETEPGELSVSWQDREAAPTEEVLARGVRIASGGGLASLSAREATVRSGRVRVLVKDGQLELGLGLGGVQVRALTAASIDGEVELGSAVLEEASPSAAGSSAPFSAAAPSARGGGEVPWATWTRRAQQLRGQLLDAVHAVDALLAPTARIELGGMRLRVRRGDDVLNLGPGGFRVRREDGQMVLELAPASGALVARANEQALTFRVSVPLGEASTDIVADVDGGPITFATLGVHEGDFGLLDVGSAAVVTRSRLTLAADGRSVALDGEGKVHRLSLRSAALSAEAVRGLELAWRAKGEVLLDGSRVRLEAGELDLGAIRLKATGSIEQVGTARVIAGEVEVPLTACQAMLESLPSGLAPRLAGMRMAGSFAVRGRGQIDTARIDHGFRLGWEVSNSCRITEAPPEIAVERFSRPFTHAAYGPDGRRVEVEAGPGTSGWAPFSAISKFMEVAVLTTEDGAFHRHHGFDEEAIRNSIRENLREGRFVRGASTISMQLAKNLYLDRTKNLSRKLQEAVLTMYLEQELTKDQILELYFNVVELGPMLYGVGSAARHYFASNPMDLSLGQALYLASVLPNPKIQHFAAGGAVSAGWTRYLRKLMRVAHARKRISDEELEEALLEVVVRGSPAPRRQSKEGADDTGSSDSGPEGNETPLR